MKNFLLLSAFIGLFSVTGVAQISLTIYTTPGSTAVTGSGSYTVEEGDWLSVSLPKPAWTVRYIWRYWVLHSDNTLSAVGRSIQNATSAPGSTVFSGAEIDDDDITDPPALEDGDVYLYGGKPVLTVEVDYKVINPPNPPGHNVVTYDYDNVCYDE